MSHGAFIVDTNVVVSGILSGNSDSPPARILRAMLDNQLLYPMSGTLLAEYAEVLRRPSVARVHRLSAAEIAELLTVLAANAQWRQPTVAVRAPDPGDDHLWSRLGSQPQSRLITGDRLLLESSPRPGVVLTPGQAVRVIGWF